MPTEKKVQRVAEIQEELSRCTIAISTDYRGLPGTVMTDMRRHFREKGLKYTVIKNTLALRAANAVGKVNFDKLTEGPTGLVFGYGDASEAARVVDEFVRNNRSPLVIRRALLGNQLLSATDVADLAGLPPREQIIARLLGRVKAPMYGLANVLNGPLQGLITVLQRRAEQQGQASA